MSPGILDEKMYVYAATGLTAGGMALEAGEDIRLLLLTWRRGPGDGPRRPHPRR